jgi:hypothetical protein
MTQVENLITGVSRILIPHPQMGERYWSVQFNHNPFHQVKNFRVSSRRNLIKTRIMRESAVFLSFSFYVDTFPAFFP